MSLSLTTNKLLDSIKRRGMIPIDQKTFTNADLLEIINEEILTGMLPELLTLHEEYFVHSQDIPMIVGKKEYAIPYRAIGNKLRGLQLIDQSGNIKEIGRSEIEKLPMDNRNEDFDTFYLKDNRIVLNNPPTSNLSILRMYYYIRPNAMVEEDRACKIVSIDRDSNIIVVNRIPDNFQSLPSLDLISFRTPNRIYNYDVPLLTVNNATKVLSIDMSKISEDLIVGDFITMSEETIIPQLPVELHSVLAQRVAITCMETMGDKDGVALANNKLNAMRALTSNLVDNRVETANKKVMNTHKIRSLRFRRS